MLQVIDIPTNPLNLMEQPLLDPWNKENWTSPQPNRRTPLSLWSKDTI